MNLFGMDIDIVGILVVGIFFANLIGKIASWTRKKEDESERYDSDYEYEDDYDDYDEDDDDDDYDDEYEYDDDEEYEDKVSTGHAMTWEEMEQQYGLSIPRKESQPVEPAPVVVVVPESELEPVMTYTPPTPAAVSTQEIAAEEAAQAVTGEAWEPRVERKRKRALPLKQGVLWSAILGPCKANERRMYRVR